MPAAIVGRLELAQAVMAECDEVYIVGVPRVICLQSPSNEEGIPKEVVV